MSTIRLAAVLTVFNRRELTLACLRSIASQESPGLKIDVFLTDDGSSDGTSEAVQAEFPDVHLLHGDGNLFWNGGMRLAFGEAMRHSYDHYLWLNDDTHLDDDALQRLLTTHRLLLDSGEGPSVIVGATRDPETASLTYGGVFRPSRWRPLRFELAPVVSEPQATDTMNGNCVLIPALIAQVVGNIDSAYVQKMGDFDYGLRVRTAGFGVWVAPDTVGTCASNVSPPLGTRPLGVELREMTSIKQLPPAPWREFARRWAGPLWPVFWASPYVREIGLVARGRIKVRHSWLMGRQ